MQLRITMHSASSAPATVASSQLPRRPSRAKAPQRGTLSRSSRQQHGHPSTSATLQTTPHRRIQGTWTTLRTTPHRRIPPPPPRPLPLLLRAQSSPEDPKNPRKASDNGEVYSNFFTSLLGNFLPGGRTKKEVVLPDALSAIDWEVPKATGLSIEELCAVLDREFRIEGREWFVTGNAPPEFFADDFLFKDPDVTVEGIKKYCAGVAKLFDAESARAETISCKVTGPDVLTLTWRLSGKVNLGSGLDLKPYVVITELKVNEDGLVCYQEDEFDAPGWDILLSAVLPGLRRWLRPAAPPVEELRERAQ